MATIELTQPRTIVIKDRKRSYSLVVGRIARADWLKYFEGIVSISEMQEGRRIDSSDSTAARLELVESKLIDAQGYAGYATSGALASAVLPEGWQQKIPLGHRLAAGNALVSVTAVDAADEDNAPLALGVEAICLNAVWGADEEGVMREYRGLCHRFRTPTAEQQRRFSRDASRSMIIGGSRTGKTRYLGARATLVALYDELIESVEGYTVDGKPLGGREQIIAEMDTYHKAVAADRLFSPAMPEITESDEAE
jgi:hypothetical protein